MNKYISILRGINVSGQKKILMADLKTIYTGLGYTHVETYIQSGNVVFDALNKKPEELKLEIEAAIESKYSFFVPVLIRTKDELEKTVAGCPFGELDLVEEGTRVLVTFLATLPPEQKVSEIQDYVIDPEKLVIIGKEVYLHCPNGYGKSKLSNTFLESKLGVSATTRNWKTVVKLNDLVSQR